MAIDATFWVAVSFVIFFGALIYLKIPQKVTEMLDKMISDIKNEIDESEKLRTEAKTLLDNAQNKLDTAQTVSNEILDEAKKDSDKLIIELNDKFHKSSEIKKNLAENKISQMKEAAIKEIQDLRKDFHKNVKIPGTKSEFNEQLAKATRVSDFLELGELFAIDALQRRESCGGHFREEFQTSDGEAIRDDENFKFVSAWEFNNDPTKPILHKEDLKYEEIEIKTRSYK